MVVNPLGVVVVCYYYYLKLQIGKTKPNLDGSSKG